MPRVFHDNAEPWGYGLFQMGWEESGYDNTGNQVKAKINTCTTASYNS